MDDGIPTLVVDEIADLRRRQVRGEVRLDAELPWLDAVDAGATGNHEPASHLRFVVFNAERGTHFGEIRDLLQQAAADIVLLSEVDWGMARSGNRHVARDLAAALGMSYAFGVEFLELTKGEACEAAVEGENTKSLHGNAILSRQPLQRARVVRLPPKCGWNEPDQARIGGRMALIAEIETAAGPLTVASVHLENRTTPEGRREQMRAVLDAVAAAPRAVIAGDLNTSTIDPGDTAQLFSIPDLLQQNPKRLVRPQVYEPLFEDVRLAGFLIDEVNEADVATQVPLGIEDPTFWLKLDWIFARGVVPAGPARVARALRGGQRISDHDLLITDLSV
jgi:endonuclease/exonuclease/phosphatase family metal-dependent hydrolase